MNNTSELVKGKQFGSTKDVVPGERAGASLRFSEFHCGLLCYALDRAFSTHARL